MRRIILFFALFLWSISLLQAQTIHLVVVASTEEPDIGKGCFQDAITMRSSVKNMAVHTGYQVKEYFVGLEYFQPAFLERKVNAIKAASEDVIIFYYSGHGQDDPNSQWPTFVMGSGNSRDSSDLLNFTKVEQWVKAKNARLNILIADCCNSALADDGFNKTDALLASKGKSKIDKMQEAFFKSLIHDVKGTLKVASSTEGEVAYTTRYGSIYTNSLDEIIRMLAGKEQSTGGWPQVLNYAKGMTQETLVAPHRQSPITQIDLAKVATAKPVERVPTEMPKPAQPPLETEAEDDRYLMAIRSMLQGGAAQRLRKMPEVLGFFSSPEAVVEIYDAKGRTRLERESAELFLERLAVTASIANVASIEVKRDSQGKITKLKIHEYYTK